MRRGGHATRYLVRPNDTLWGIARHQYGDGRAWPEIARYNDLANPTLLFVGQRLYLPPLGATPQLRNAPLPLFVGPPKPIANPAFEYDLEKHIPPVVAYAGIYKITFALTGSISIQRRGVVADFTVTNLEKIKVASKKETDTVLGQLFTNVSYTLDVKKPEFKFTSGFGVVLKTPGGGTLTYKISVGLKEVKFICEPQAVKGSFGGFDIEGQMGYEITVEGDFSHLKPSPVLVPQWSWESSMRRVRDLLPDGPMLLRSVVHFALGALVLAAVLVAMKFVVVAGVLAFAVALAMIIAAAGHFPGHGGGAI